MVLALCKAKKVSVFANGLEHHLHTRTLQNASRHERARWGNPALIAPILQVERMRLPMKCAPLNSPLGIFMR